MQKGAFFKRSVVMSPINIYVGNLSFDANEDQLKELFEGYGRVDSAKIISDQFTGRSRGFGFIEMADREEGLRAITELDSKDFKGRSLKVNEARPKRDAGRRDGGGGGGGGRGGGGGGGGGRSRW
jgi:cold-inducible RNA-binding protein